MRIRIDTSLCSGHGRCYAVAPGLIEADEEGFPVLRDADAEVPADALDAARLAVASCPEDAFLLEDG